MSRDDCLPCGWVGLSNQLETSKRMASLKEEINLSIAYLRSWTAATLSRVSAWWPILDILALPVSTISFLKNKLYMHILLVLFLWRTSYSRWNIWKYYWARQNHLRDAPWSRPEIQKIKQPNNKSPLRTQFTHTHKNKTH